jgi:hypothetical protein
VVALLGLAVSFPSMIVALIPVWRRGMRKQRDGYNELPTHVIDLEDVEIIPLVPLDAQPDRSSTEQAWK